MKCLSHAKMQQTGAEECIAHRPQRRQGHPAGKKPQALRAIILAVSVAMMTSLAGCVAVNFTGGGSLNSVRGTGEMTKVYYNTDDFTEIDVRMEVDFYYTAGYYTAGASCNAAMELQENLAEYLDISVIDGVLIVQANANFQTDGDKTPRLYITAPTLESIRASGVLAVKEADPIKGDALGIMISGVSSGLLTLDVKSLSVSMSGAGSLNISGNADQTKISMSGAATVNALELQTNTAYISISGAGTVNIDCSDELDIDVSGVGTVNYRGSPSISQRISGMGSIKRVN